MLRITTIPGDHATLLKLEGKLLQPWCDEVRSAHQRAARGGNPVRLDLDEVSYIDPAGAVLLRSLLVSGVTISRCSNFIAELLHQPEAL